MTGVSEAVEQVKRVADRVQRWRPVRVVKRFGDNDGPLLGAGMAFQALFALFAALWVGFAVAGIWLLRNPTVFDALQQIVNAAVPGLIGDGGIISIDTLKDVHLALNITAYIAAASLLWTAIGWLGSTRTAVRAMFDLGHDTTNFAVQKAVDLGLAAIFGVGLVASALLSVASTQVLDLIFDALGFGHDTPLVRIATRIVGFLVVFLVNLATLAGMYRVLSRVYIPWRNLIVGSGLGAIALGVLSAASGLLLGGAGKYSFLTSFVAIIGLLIWFNLVCQVILFCAAWIATGMQDRGLSPRRMTAEELEQERRRIAWRQELEQARANLAAAETAYDAARGWGRRRARKSMLKAFQQMRAVREGDPDRGAD